ncbi:iron-containing redox enzyme family protein [Actinomadura opuntiae]|uniref:iron-containing redox enzyme family protein n=1 Tax=Actinomadura sp. OS1-43 TaxID=604315 RepID=UPI00255AF7A4|nr:iron-containing redox enzyme family protein [Actinomadura sp. OS1-43]MDL4821993.1 iron-containing redox enzyme family protein [Actinomadura sp. OS1-43]
MTSLAGSAVSSDLLAHARQTLDGSAFFSDLGAGKAPVEVVRDVFGQYYLWRNQFHRWLGVCVVKSPAFGTESDASRVLSGLTAHIREEVGGDHHGLAVRLLRALGIERPAAVTPLPVTAAYCASFPARYLDPARSGAEAVAALAGREIASPARNRIVIDALSAHYGVASGLEFLTLHETKGPGQFAALWDVLVNGYFADEALMARAAREEIGEHVGFWDAVYAQLTRGLAGVPA